MRVGIVFLIVFGMFSCNKWEVIEKEKIYDSAVMLGTWEWIYSIRREHCTGPNYIIRPDSFDDTFELEFVPGLVIRIYKDGNFMASHGISFKYLDISEDIVESHRKISFGLYIDSNKEPLYEGIGTQQELRFSYPIYPNTDCHTFTTYWKKKK